MVKLHIIVIVAAFFAGRAVAQDGAGAADAADPSAESEPSAEPEAPASTEGSDGGVKTLAGMSILGNEEAPKALVIVPWKSSQIGDGVGVTDAMDDRPRPVDKEVFMREVHYYGLRSGAEE